MARTETAIPIQTTIRNGASENPKSPSTASRTIFARRYFVCRPRAAAARIRRTPGGSPHPREHAADEMVALAHALE